MKKYFYCQSYPAFLYAMYLEKIKKSNITILTSSCDIQKACKYLKLEFISFDYLDRSSFHNLKSKIDLETKKLLNIMGNSELLFSHTEFELFCFYLVDRHIENGGKVIFYDFEQNSSKIKFPKFSKEYLLKLLYIKRLPNLYNLEIELRSQSRKKVLIGLRQETFEKIGIIRKDVRHDYFNQLSILFKTIKLPYNHIKNIFAAQYLTDKNTFHQHKITQLINFIESQKNKILIKKHPNDVDLIVNVEELPKFIPVELFLNYIENTFISIYSLSLISASKYSNKIKVISLIEFDIIINKKLKNKMKQKLIKESNNRIYFPKDYNELKKLIDGK